MSGCLKVFYEVSIYSYLDKNIVSYLVPVVQAMLRLGLDDVVRNVQQNKNCTYEISYHTCTKQGGWLSLTSIVS